MHCDVFNLVRLAALQVNPCFNVYHISWTCPHTYSQLGITDKGDYT